MPDKKGSDDRAYARGFAAGRAAATPDPPHTPDCSANMLANFADCSCAATPDPQDEEACLRWTCESCGWNVVVPMPGYAGDGHYHYGPPQNTRCGPLVARREGFIRALPGADLLAAPSHGGDEAAGTPTTVLNTEPSSAAASRERAGDRHMSDTRARLRGRAYRFTAKLLHRFDLHHTVRIGPLEPDGVIVHRCEWCGVSRTETPLAVTLRRMREAADACRSVSAGSDGEDRPDE